MIDTVTVPPVYNQHMAILTIIRGNEAGRQFTLQQVDCFIGRDPAAPVCLPSRSVSRRHAQVICQQGRYLIEDLGSVNGTFMNGEKLRERRSLRDGDELGIGEFVLAFRQETELDDSEFHVRERVHAVSANPLLYGENPAQKLQIVLELAQHLGQTLDVESLLDRLLHHLLRLFPEADRGMVVLCEGERLMVRAQRSRREGIQDYPFSRTIVRQALQEGTGLLSEDARSDERFSGSSTLGETEIRAVVCVPLIGQNGRRLGVVQLDATRPGLSFHLEHLRLLTTIGLQVSVVLENVELNAIRLREETLRRELAVGRDIQQVFLPANFANLTSKNVELFARVTPAREVAGDLYDFFDLPDGRLALFLGDVSGKGIPAALFMFAVRALSRHLAPTARNPAETLLRLNDALVADNPTSMFVTMVHAIFDPRDGSVVLASGGHPPPLLRHADGQIEEIDVRTGRILGCMEGSPGVHDTHFTLVRGDTLILYSDGYTEAFSPGSDKIFGLDRFRQELSGARTQLPLAQCADEVRRAVERFTDSAVPQDDLTLLLLRRI